MHNPVYNGDLIYSPYVIVFKSDTETPELLSEKDRYKVNVISCAAPNLRRRPSNRMNPHAGDKKAVLSEDELYEIHLARGRRVLDTAVKFGNEVVILGAFGCGAFCNPPEIVAKACRKLFYEYANYFETIEFAVYCPPENDTNYQAFQKAFARQVTKEEELELIYVKNIKLAGNIVSMDCYINGDESRHFFLKFNVETWEVIENTCAEEFTYAGRAIANITRTLREDMELPEATWVAWY